MLWIPRSCPGAVGVLAGGVLVLCASAATEPTGPRLVTSTRGPLRRSSASRDGSVTPDGRFVAFSSSTRTKRGEREISDVLVKDMETGRTRPVSVDSAGRRGNGTSASGCISSDGRFVVFESWADNLVADDRNGCLDVFIHDMETKETRRLSVAEDGAEADGGSSTWACSSVSADGRWVAFSSIASNLVPGVGTGVSQVYRKDAQTGAISLVSVNASGMRGDGNSESPSISGNGRFIVYCSQAANLAPGDANGFFDVFVFDRETGEARRVSRASDGTEADGGSFSPVVSDDGIVAFESSASNLVSGDTNHASDIFLHDPSTGQTRRISVAADGRQAGRSSHGAAISRNGDMVVFSSDADGLAPEDRNGATDAFAFDIPTGTLRLLSADQEGNPGNSDSLTMAASLSFDGTWCVLESMATNLVRHHRTGHVADIYLVRARNRSE